MKILAASDIHGDQQNIEELVKLAEKEKVDAIILAGDLTFGESSLVGIVGPFKKIGKPIMLIPGNHETPATVDFLCKKYAPQRKKHIGKWAAVQTVWIIKQET